MMSSSKSGMEFADERDISINSLVGPRIQGDRDRDVALQQEQYNAAEEILQAFGGILKGADETLTDLEDQSEVLPSAILRKCREFADGIGHLAKELESHSPEEQEALAKACAEDFQQLSHADSNELLLEEEPTSSAVASTADLEKEEFVSGHQDRAPSEQDFLAAIQGASTLLRDIEASFREISETDAEDIADATLTLARLFLISLQNVYETMTPDDLIATAERTREQALGQSSTVQIEELDTEQSSGDNTQGDSTSRKARSTTQNRRRESKRLRVLWPRLGPEVAKVLNWGKEQATQQPVLAAVLGLTLWPAAILTTVVGGSLVLADHALQDAYQHFQDGPIVSNLEQGAAQVFQAGKLGVLVSLVVGKQTLRVVQRQVKRHGGVEQIAMDLKDAAVDRVLNPIETIGMAWDGLSWGVSTVTDTLQQVLQQREEFLAIYSDGQDEEDVYSV